MRPWLNPVATSNTWHLDSTWYNSRSIPTGSAEENLCHPFICQAHYGDPFSALSLLQEETKPENDPVGDTCRGRCSLLRMREETQEYR